MFMKEVKLRDIADVFSGLSYRRYLEDNGNEFEVIVQRSIKNDGIFDDFQQLTLKSDIKDRYFSKNEDVLMKMNYPYNVVCCNREGLIISDRIAIIRLKQGFSPLFISHLLNNAHIKKQLHEHGNNEKTPHISLKEIKELTLRVPDLDTQIKYGNLLNVIDEKIAEDLKLIRHDRNLKEGILNKLWDVD